MRDGTFIVGDKQIRFTMRKDADPRGQAFWIRVRHGDGIQFAPRSVFFAEFVKAFHQRQLSVEGGEFGGWDWQLLATSDMPGTDLGSDDQISVQEWLSNRNDVAEFEVGPLVSPTNEYDILLREFENAESRYTAK